MPLAKNSYHKNLYKQTVEVSDELNELNWEKNFVEENQLANILFKLMYETRPSKSIFFQSFCCLRYSISLLFEVLFLVTLIETLYIQNIYFIYKKDYKYNFSMETIFQKNSILLLVILQLIAVHVSYNYCRAPINRTG